MKTKMTLLLLIATMAAWAAPAPYVAKDFGGIVGTKGFSATLLSNHFKLYQGYVANVNKLGDELKAMLAAGQEATPVFAELKRRMGWEFDGMRLHELYFGNIGSPAPLATNTALHQTLVEQFGSIEAWKRDFVATGKMRGIGWVVLYKDPQSGKLFNMWINEHDTGHPAGCTPLLVMDVFEHAYMTDYQIDKAGYIAAFMEAINWTAVAAR